MSTSTPITAPDGRVHVAVGVLARGAQLLVQQRRADAPCAGQWEFPGGKIHRGESPQDALARELHEELAVQVTRSRELLRLPFDYPHARVWLEVFMVDSFDGEIRAREGQAIRWLCAERIARLDALGAVHPILRALAQG